MNTNDVSNKTKKATEEKIPIMTPEMFKEKYNIKIFDLGLF